MSELEVLLKNWSFPARSPERAQLTLRVPIYDHQRLLALKEVYPNRSINDMVVDILEAALNDIESSLPVAYYTKKDIEEMDPEELNYSGAQVGHSYGVKVRYQNILARIRASNVANEEGGDKQ